MSIMHVSSQLIRRIPASWRWVLLGLLILTSLTTTADEKGAEKANTVQYPEFIQLNHLSQNLISKIKAGTAEAVSFRTDVVFYRESLRTLMLKNEKLTQHRVAKPLLMEMVRMAALLQSAAECHTGRYISCPANLMHDLEHQQKRLGSILSGKSSSP